MSYLEGFTAIANLLSQAVQTAGQAYKSVKDAENPAVNHRHDSIRENIDSVEHSNQQSQAIQEAKDAQKRIEEEKKKADLEKQLKIKKLQISKFESQKATQVAARETLLEELSTNGDLSAVRNHISKDLENVNNASNGKERSAAKSQTLVNVKSFLEGEKQARELNPSETKLLSLINVSVAKDSEGKGSKIATVNVSSLAENIKSKPKAELSKAEKLFASYHEKSLVADLKIKQEKITDTKVKGNGSSIDLKDTQSPNKDIKITDNSKNNDKGKSLNTISNQVDIKNKYANEHAVL